MWESSVGFVLNWICLAVDKEGDNRSAALWKWFLCWVRRSVVVSGPHAGSCAIRCKRLAEGSAACDIVCSVRHRRRLFGFSPTAHPQFGARCGALDHSRPYYNIRPPQLKFMHRRARSCKERYTFAGINLPRKMRARVRTREGCGVLYLNIRMRGGHRPLAAASLGISPQYCGNESNFIIHAK